MPKVKRRRIKKIPIPKLKAKADKVFSNYIRNRDGWKCTICGKTKKNGVALQNGHYVKRGIVSVRYNEINNNCICNICNFRDNIHHHFYEKAIRAKWGNIKVDEMLAMTTHPITNLRALLEEVIKRYG